MKTQIQSVHCNADDHIQDFIRKKIDKLEKLYNRIENATIILRKEKSKHNRNEIVEIELRVPGHRLFACNQSEHFEIAADLAVDELKRQLEKRRHKLPDW